MSNEQLRILARVRKLMNLAQDAGATEGERDNALRMAHATLAKYNLDIAQVEEASSIGSKDEPREQQSDTFHGRPWARIIGLAIAELYFCKYFTTGKGRTVKHSFVGRHSNVITAMEMSKFITNAVYQEASKCGRQFFEGGEGKVARNFATGASHRIWERCREIRNTAEAAPKTPGSALVLANVYAIEKKANDDFLAARGVRLGTGRRTKGAGEQGYAAGRAFGSSVSLSQQVGGSSQLRIKGQS